MLRQHVVITKNKNYLLYSHRVIGTTNAGSGGGAEQCCNPAFVHALVVPDLDIVEKVGKICAVARGDGVVSIINIESELAGHKSKSSTKANLSAKSTSVDHSSADQNNSGNLHLDYSMGGHGAAVSSV